MEAAQADHPRLRRAELTEKRTLSGLIHAAAPAQDNFDIAIRVGSLSDSRLKAKLLASNRRIVCAAPGYLEQRRRSGPPGDVEHHN